MECSGFNDSSEEKVPQLQHLRKVFTFVCSVFFSLRSLFMHNFHIERYDSYLCDFQSFRPHGCVFVKIYRR